MAAQTIVVSTLFDAQGNIASVSFTFDNVTFLVLSVTVVNNLSFDVAINATNTLPPNQSFSNSIPKGLNQTIDVSLVNWALDPTDFSLLAGWTFGF